MHKIIHLNYPVNFSDLLLSAEKAKESSRDYYDPRYPGHNFDYWKINHYTDEKIEKIISDFGVNMKPRFYWLKPNAVIPVHVDNGTKCSINFVLSDEAAPITYSGVDYFYRQALINTSIPHGVTNGPHERILLKLSIFDIDYSDLSKTIKFRNTNCD